MTDRVIRHQSLQAKVIAGFDRLAIVRLLRFMQRHMNWKDGAVIVVTIAALMPVLVEILPFVLLPILVVFGAVAMCSPILLVFLPLLALGSRTRRGAEAACRCATCGETFQP